MFDGIKTLRSNVSDSLGTDFRDMDGDEVNPCSQQMGGAWPPGQSSKCLPTLTLGPLVSGSQMFLVISDFDEMKFFNLHLSPLKPKDFFKNSSLES